MYPSKKEFKEALTSRPFDWIIDQYLLKGVPFYSASEPDLHTELLRAISTGLGVTRTDIGVVGSARVGFSLDPDKFGEPFNDFSDLDIMGLQAVVWVKAAWVTVYRP